MDKTKGLEKIQSDIGTTIGDPHSPIAERAPNSARLVARVLWSWSAAEYRIASDRARKTWNLYNFIQHHDTGKRICSRIVTGTPYRGVSATRAAYQLLKAAWLDEANHFEFDPVGICVNEEGLLSSKELVKLAEEVGWLNSSDWFQRQSEPSLAILHLQLPSRMDNQSYELVEEIEACATDLGLDQDFVSLCSHYRISPPELTALLEPLLQEAEVVREQRRLLAVANADKLRQQIDLLVRDQSDTPGRYPGGGSIASPRSRIKKFIEEYVGRHCGLPTGTHKVNDMFGPVVDFDALRREMGL